MMTLKIKLNRVKKISYIFLSLIMVLILVIELVPDVIASEINNKWAFYNDGTFSYDDNIGSWYGEIGTIKT